MRIGKRCCNIVPCCIPPWIGTVNSGFPCNHKFVPHVQSKPVNRSIEWLSMSVWWPLKRFSESEWKYLLPDELLHIKWRKRKNVPGHKIGNQNDSKRREEESWCVTRIDGQEKRDKRKKGNDRERALLWKMCTHFVFNLCGVSHPGHLLSHLCLTSLSHLCLTSPLSHSLFQDVSLVKYSWLDHKNVKMIQTG